MYIVTKIHHELLANPRMHGGGTLIPVSEPDLQATAEAEIGMPSTDEGDIPVNQVGQRCAACPAMARVVFGFPPQRQARRQFKGFFHVDPRTAVGIDPGAGLQVERQQVADAEHGPALIEIRAGRR